MASVSKFSSCSEDLDATGTAFSMVPTLQKTGGILDHDLQCPFGCLCTKWRDLPGRAFAEANGRSRLSRVRCVTHMPNHILNRDSPQSQCLRSTLIALLHHIVRSHHLPNRALLLEPS